MLQSPFAAGVALVALALLPPAGAAQPADPVDMAAAKREGNITWYTSTPVAQAQKIANLFQAETGIKVELFRSGGSAVLRRFVQEIDARRVVADVLTISDPAAASMLIKRDMLVPFRPRNFDKVPDAVKHPRGYHVAQRLNLVGIVARTDKGLDLPKNWTDLTDPRYKGKLVMPDPSYTAIQLMVVGTLSQKYGWDFYRKLRANEIMIVQSHQQVSDALTRGERLIAAE
ncbi:MAG: extracellular solute-binding protein, partial [Dehalococcoidia bacterium]|nr:extracellular solute-binding protein [Dehalococcoidia bacterium]